MNAKRLLLVLVAGIATIFKGFSGDGDSDKIRFYYDGDKGLSPKTCLYKIDNETKSGFISGYLPFGYNKTHKVGGFDIALSPGTHTFEIVLNDKSTMTKKSKNVVAKRITLKMESGNEYVFERNDFEIDVICKSKSGKVKADYTLEDVPVYTEPSTNAPCAILKYAHEKDAEVDPYISRIDDIATGELGELFGACNYALPVDFKYFSGTKGELNLKIAPGAHKIEYLILGETVVDGLVQTVNFTFEVDKKYKIILDQNKTKDKSKSSASIRIVEDK